MSVSSVIFFDKNFLNLKLKDLFFAPINLSLGSNFLDNQISRSRISGNETRQGNKERTINEGWLIQDSHSSRFIARSDALLFDARLIVDFRAFTACQITQYVSKYPPQQVLIEYRALLRHSALPQ